MDTKQAKPSIRDLCDPAYTPADKAEGPQPGPGEETPHEIIGARIDHFFALRSDDGRNHDQLDGQMTVFFRQGPVQRMPVQFVLHPRPTGAVWEFRPARFSKDAAKRLERILHQQLPTLLAKLLGEAV